MPESKSEDLPSNDAALPSWVTGIPKALVPSSLKALDRLVGAAVDYPVALFRRATAKIDSQTKAYEIVEAAIAKSAGEIAGADSATVDRALKVLIRKEYRKQSNREAVAAEAVNELKSDSTSASDNHDSTTALDDDWLNVFERFAEDASSDRMQGLWGRVLAGEIRKPGKFSLRTLRFLSEFSQSDAILFANISSIAVGQMLLKSLILPEGKDIRSLMQLEAAGLIADVNGMGLKLTLTFDASGHAMIDDDNLRLVFRGDPGTDVTLQCLSLTPLGLEVLSLIPDRDARSAMRRCAQEVKSNQIKAAFIGHAIGHNQINLIEELWTETVEQ